MKTETLALTLLLLISWTVAFGTAILMTIAERGM